MRLKISRFPLSRFQELIPLLLRCFPEFWQPRLSCGLCSFPYDLKLFAGRTGDRLVACIGIHDYQVILNNGIVPLGGLCDVAVDPDYRGLGLAHQLQDYVIEYCRRKTVYSAMPLYTDKPGVYLSHGWQIYECRRRNEISSADFLPRDTFSLAGTNLDLKRARQRCCGRLNTEEKSACRIIRIYMEGHCFPGKCLRSEKTWEELFADRKHRWHLEQDTYYLYRDDRLLEAYSLQRDHPVAGFLPAMGGHDENKVMIHILNHAAAQQNGLAEHLAAGDLIFPAADVF